MQIQKSGRANDLFMSELQKRMAQSEGPAEKQKEQQLQEDRDDKSQEAEANVITEQQLPEKGERKDEPVQQTMEGQLQDNRKESKAAAPNADKQGITEQRLNQATKSLYPHRNPQAHERTGDQRPINALQAEMGKQSDQAKRERYEKARQAGEKTTRVVDKDVGSQMSIPKTEIKAFNFHRMRREAKPVSADRYVEYRLAQAGKGKIEQFAEVKDLDDCMTEIMQTAQKENRNLTEDEMAKIAAFKQRKSALLGVLAARPEPVSKEKGLCSRCKKSPAVIDGMCKSCKEDSLDQAEQYYANQRQEG